MPGHVKTRLIPCLGAERAAALHLAFVHDILDRLNGAFDVELHTDILTDAWQDHRVASRLQAPGDLGAKMFAALGFALRSGHSKAMILGSDSPTLPLEYIQSLLLADADVALGPAEDGGFWGIACRRVAPSMFEGVPWSSADTFQRTHTACQAAGLSTAAGPLWYDVDDESSLQRLAADPHLPLLRRTAFALSSTPDI